MSGRQTISPLRKVTTRVLATASMLGLYAVGGLAITGLVFGGVAPSYAQQGKKGRGQGGGGGGGGGGGPKPGGGPKRGGGGGGGGAVRGGRGRGGGGGNIGTGIAVGIGAAIIGGAIEAQRRSEYEAAVRECQRRYGRNYILETHEFVGRDGGYYPCP